MFIFEAALHWRPDLLFILFSMFIIILFYLSTVAALLLRLLGARRGPWPPLLAPLGLPYAVLGPPLGSPGSLLECFRGLWGTPWGLLGSLQDLLGHSWALYAQMLIVVRNNAIFRNCLRSDFSVCWKLLMFFEGPDPSRKVEDIQGKHFHLISSKSDHRSRKNWRKNEIKLASIKLMTI